MSAESDAAWLTAEDEYIAALQRKIESRAMIQLAGSVVDARKVEAMRAEMLLGKVLERAQRARADLDEASTLLEQALRLVRGE